MKSKREIGKFVFDACDHTAPDELGRCLVESQIESRTIATSHHLDQYVRLKLLSYFLDISCDIRGIREFLNFRAFLAEFALHVAVSRHDYLFLGTVASLRGRDLTINLYVYM